MLVVRYLKSCIKEIINVVPKIYSKMCFIGVALINSLVHGCIDWLIYVQNILKPSFVSPFDVVGRRHWPTLPASTNDGPTCNTPQLHNG